MQQIDTSWYATY